MWIGNDAPQIKLNQGSAMAAQLWKIIMTKLHDGLESKKFEQPDNIIRVNICSQSGKLPTELCSHDPRGSTIMSEMFVNGTQPTEFCETHVELMIDTTNNKIANEFCPEENVETRVFIKRNPPYNPEEHGGIVPSDYQYTAPTEECNVHNQENTIDDYLDDLLDDNNLDDNNLEDDNIDEEIENENNDDNDTNDNNNDYENENNDDSNEN